MSEHFHPRKPDDTTPNAQSPQQQQPLVCAAYKPRRSGSLVGFCDIHIVGWQLTLYGLTCHEHLPSGRRWVQLAGRPCLDSSGELLRDERNKVIYSKTLKFDTVELLRHFSDRAVAAVIAFAPDAFTPFPPDDNAHEGRLL